MFMLAMLLFNYLGCFVSLAFGAYMFAVAVVDIIKNKLHSINEMANDKKSRENIYEKLSDFIETHANLEQLREWYAQEWIMK